MMKIDEYLDLLRTRRSIRRFKTDPIPDEYVEKILEAARWAMSGGNGQPWEFIVVKDQETKRKMAESYVDIGRRLHDMEKVRVEELRHPIFSAPHAGLPHFIDAPVVIIVMADRRRYQATILAIHFLSEGEGGPDATFYKGVANATQNIQQAAVACGLGSAWFSVTGLWEPSLKQILGVPVEFSIPTIVPIGYPAQKPTPIYRRPLNDLVHYEKFDMSKYKTDDDIYNYIADLRRWSKNIYQKPQNDVTK
jgi:nitroreductase